MPVVFAGVPLVGKKTSPMAYLVYSTLRLKTLEVTLAPGLEGVGVATTDAPLTVGVRPGAARVTLFPDCQL